MNFYIICRLSSYTFVSTGNYHPQQTVIMTPQMENVTLDTLQRVLYMNSLLFTVR